MPTADDHYKHHQDWTFIRDHLHEQHINFTFTPRKDARGNIQVVTTGHPTVHGYKVSRQDLLAHCRGTKHLVFDPPGTRQRQPSRLPPLGAPYATV